MFGLMESRRKPGVKGFKPNCSARKPGLSVELVMCGKGSSLREKAHWKYLQSKRWAVAQKWR